MAPSAFRLKQRRTRKKNYSPCFKSIFSPPLHFSCFYAASINLMHCKRRHFAAFAVISCRKVHYFGDIFHLLSSVMIIMCEYCILQSMNHAYSYIYILFNTCVSLQMLAVHSKRKLLKHVKNLSWNVFNYYELFHEEQKSVWVGVEWDEIWSVKLWY